MRRKRRTEILVNSSIGLAADLAEDIISKYEVKTIEQPNHGLVMVKARETAKNSLFYLGEVMVTECKVEINGCIGIGILKGDEPQKAFYLAVIDATYQAGLKETNDWAPRLLSAEENILRSRIELSQQILKTKVNFETMDVD